MLYVHIGCCVDVGCRGNRTWQWRELMVIAQPHRRVPRPPRSSRPIAGRPLKSRASATAAGWPRCCRTNPRRSVIFCFSFSLFFSFCCQVGFGACKWHKSCSHFTVCCVYLLHCSKRQKKYLFSSITCSFLRAVWCDTCSCHSWCLAYASLS